MLSYNTVNLKCLTPVPQTFEEHCCQTRQMKDHGNMATVGYAGSGPACREEPMPSLHAAGGMLPTSCR